MALAPVLLRKAFGQQREQRGQNLCCLSAHFPGERPKFA